MQGAQFWNYKLAQCVTKSVGTLIGYLVVVCKIMTNICLILTRN